MQLHPSPEWGRIRCLANDEEVVGLRPAVDGRQRRGVAKADPKLADAANQDTAGQLRVRFCNYTAATTVNGAALTYNYLVIR